MSSNSIEVTTENAILRPAGRRINPDSIATLRFTIAGAVILAATSFLVSFAGLTAIAAWTGIPAWMGWALPVFIDMAIIVYAMAVLIHRSRGEKTAASWVSLTGFTLVSVFANGAHALSVPQTEQWHSIVGAVLAALAPIAVFSAVEELGRLVIDQTPRKQARKAAKTKASSRAPRIPNPAPLATASRMEPTNVMHAMNVTAFRGLTAVDSSHHDANMPGGVDQELLEWARGEHPADITAAAIANQLGQSRRTGQDRLKELRSTHPEVFQSAPQQKAVDA